MFEYVYLKYFCCHVALLFLLTAMSKESVGAQLRGTPADDFTRHLVVQPIVHHGRSKREITSTRDTAGEHLKQVTVTVPVDGEEYVLELALNERLVSRDHVISYQEDGRTVLHKPTKQELDLCQYSGTVRGKPGSWVAVSTCRGVSGVIHDGRSVKYIEPAAEDGINGQHFIYDHMDLKTTHALNENNAPDTNATSPLLLEKHPAQILEQGSSRFKRHAMNFEKRYVELALVADNTLYNNKGQSIENVNRYFMDITNVVNAMFLPLNIDIRLVRVVVWKERDEIHIDRNILVTRDNFAHYRKVKLVTEFINDFAHLITGHSFNNNNIGSVYRNQVCTNDKAVGVSSVFSSEVGRMASLVARQVGRSVGMNVNRPHCDCRGPHCILYDVIVYSGGPQNQWSNCNMWDLAAAYANNQDYCLRNVPKPVCGDGPAQKVKQCECGQVNKPECVEYCTNHCKRITSSTSNLRSLIDTFKTSIPDIAQLNEIVNLYQSQSDITMKVCIEPTQSSYIYY